MKLLSLILLLSLNLWSATETSLSVSQWQSKLDELIQLDPEFQYNVNKLEIVQKQTQQSMLFFVPKFDLFYSSAINKDVSTFKNFDYGISAQVNLFQFGKSYYSYLGQSSVHEYEKLEYLQKKYQIENRLLTSLFKNTLLQRKLVLYKQIETLKRKALKVAQQRYERGNLARQQVDKVEIDLSNLSSQRATLERELADSELEIIKYKLSDFKREWPLSASVIKDRKPKRTEDYADVKILSHKTEALENSLKATRSGFLPSIDLSGHTYEHKIENLPTSHEWDVSLTATWPLWDNYSRSLENLNAYREFQFWQTEKDRTIRDWDKKVQTKEDQLNTLTAQLKQSAENLKKLNSLYSDTETLFSQGRITVNELFQDQQLLLETQINYENELHSFHTYILEYCTFHSQRIWTCF